MRFYRIWHNNSIGHLIIEDLTGLFLAPTPKVLEKKLTIYLLYVVWSIGLFVEFVALLTKSWPKILIFTVTAGERAVMPAPPPSHQEVIDVI